MTTLDTNFPELSAEQSEKLKSFAYHLVDWNDKINLISRKDVDNVLDHHITHSLGIGKLFSFRDETRILDVGTGGGLPGIPLAIYFPRCRFHLIDATAKKIMAVNDIIEKLELKNVTAEQVRLENHHEAYEFIVSRAVTRLGKFTAWLNPETISKNHRHDFRNGIMYLKGGEVSEEIRETSFRSSVYHLSEFFPQDFFKTKKVIHLYR